MLSSIESLKIKAKLLQKAKKKAGKAMLLKDALAAVAKAAGYKNWRELKKNMEESDLFCPPRSSAFWKTWYASYEEACSHLEKKPETFLLPYRKQFFVCDIHFIEKLGINAEDPDLIKIGNDWVHPLDSIAWNRVLKKIRVQRARK